MKIMKSKINKNLGFNNLSMGKKFALIPVFLLISIASSFAQTVISDVKRVYLQNIKAITENDEVKGYYAFAKTDKTKGKDKIYSLTIMDLNLDVINTVEIGKGNNIISLESSYNGDAFCFSFLNFNKKVIEYVILDKKGETEGTYTTERLSNSEMNYMNTLLPSEDYPYSGGIIAVPGEGFVRYGMEKEGGWRYIMEMINNKGKKEWEATSGDDNKKAYEWAKPMFANQNTIVTMVNSRNKMLDEGKVYCVFTDVKTGEAIFKTEVESEDGKYLYQPIGISFDNNTKEFFLYGEYFKTNKDKVVKGNSLGLYFQDISSKGTVKTENFASWTDDISKVLKVDSKGRMEGGLSLAIHNMIRMPDGKIFAIGEQYKKALNAGAIAMGMLAGGSNTSMIQIELHDMVIIEFDDKMSIESAKTFKKAITDVPLPTGYEMMNLPMIGFILKSYGLFNYNFTQISPDKKEFSCAYTNCDRKGKDDKESSNFIVGSITYDGSELKLDKVRLPNKPSDFIVMPGKPGYVALMEYYYKKKVIEFSLQKLD